MPAVFIAYTFLHDGTRAQTSPLLVHLQETVGKDKYPSLSLMDVWLYTTWTSATWHFTLKIEGPNMF